MDTPHLRSPTTLVRSVVRTRDIAVTDAITPRCVETVRGFAFYNEAGEELLGEDTLENHHSYLFDEDDDKLMDNATENFAMFPENNYGPSLSQLDMEVFLIIVTKSWKRLIIQKPSPQCTTTTTAPPENTSHHSAPHLVEDVDSDDDEPDPIDICNEEADYDDIASTVNNFFDDSDDYLSAELKSITDHHYLNGILEFKVE